MGIKRINVSIAKQIISGAASAESFRTTRRISPEDHAVLSHAEKGRKIVEGKIAMTRGNLVALHPKLRLYTIIHRYRHWEPRLPEEEVAKKARKYLDSLGFGNQN